MGIFAADRAAWFWVLALCGGLIITAFIARKREKRSWAIWLAAALSLASYALWHQAALRHIAEFPLADTIEEGQSVTIRGIGWIASRPDAGTRSLSATLHLQQLQIGSHTVRCDHRMPVWIQSAPKAIAYGTIIEFSGLVQPLDGPGAPGGFDPAAFYYRQMGALARLEILEGDQCIVLNGREGSHLIAFAQKLRDQLERGLLAGLSPEDLPYARLIAAMTLGARENSPEDLEEWFRLSGTMHLFAVSGLHVGIFGGILLFVALLFRLPKRWAALIVIPLILFYAVLTGLRPSAVRAAIMLSVVLASFVVKEQPRLLNSLSFAALLLLAFDPQQLFLPGFQLSFAVLLAIILLARRVQGAIAEPWLTDSFIPRKLMGPTRRAKDRAVMGITAALAISLVSWLGSLGPLTWHFHSFSPVGIIANLLMVPLAGIMVTLAAASLGCFGFHLTWISGFINQLNVGIAILLTGLAQFFATLPGAYRHTGSLAKQQLSQDSLVIDVMGERGEMASLVTFPPDSNALWMIDCGGPHTYKRQMLPLLRNRGINHLDALIITHGDHGHIGAAPGVLSQLKPSLLLEGPGKNRSPTYPLVVALADSLGTRRVSLAAGQNLRSAENVTWQILAPSSGRAGRFADDRVLVMKLNYLDWTVLFTSDAGFETEKQLLQSKVNLKSDLWIRGQHRDSPSGLREFVSAVSPRVVISTHSSFPTAERISLEFREQLLNLNAQLLELDQSGVITVHIDRKTMNLTPFSDPGASVELTPLTR